MEKVAGERRGEWEFGTNGIRGGGGGSSSSSSSSISSSR